MNLLTRAAAATILGLGLTVAQADPKSLKPMEAETFDLVSHTAVVYYLDTASGYDVVTTIGPNLGFSGVTTQHRTHVLRCQDYSITIDVDGIRPSTTISITTQNDKVLVARR